MEQNIVFFVNIDDEYVIPDSTSFTLYSSGAVQQMLIIEQQKQFKHNPSNNYKQCNNK